MRLWRIILPLLCGAALLPPGPGSALQIPDRLPPAERSVADSAPWTGTHEVEVRWLHARQRPELTRFESSRITLHFVGIAAAEDRQYAVRTCCPVRRGSLRIGDDGEVLDSWVEPPDFAGMLDAGRDVHTIGYASRLLALRGAAMLDDSRLWDIAPLRPPALRPGSTTRDTLRLRAQRFGFLQSLDGPRLTTLLRDTVVEGRRLWIGRDSARVRYRERVLHWRRSLDTTVVVSREAAGTLRGRFLYDPDLGLFQARWDTLVAAGEATLRLPDGTLYRTPASYERRSAWALRTREAQRARDAAERDRRRRQGPSMVDLPRTPLEERVSAGDTAAADSLLRAWQGAGPAERSRIRQALDFAPPPFRERLDSLVVAEGGWISEVGQMTRRVWAGPPVDSAGMVEYLKLLRDPSLAFDHGMDPDPAYENLAGGLVMYPPTLGAPARRTSCTPAACRLVAAEGDAREPRLRKVALVARFILDPERWVDSLLSRPDTASHLLHDAVLLARGVGATWPAAEKRPIPPPGAGWREWRRWTGVAGSPGMWHGGEPLVRFRDSHLYAIRMTERLTGREIGAELAVAADTARSDTARAVFRALALRVGSVRPTVAEIIPGLRSADATERQLAFAALEQHTAEQRPAGAALAEEVVGQLLAQAIDGDSIWTGGREGRRPVRRVEGDSDPPPDRPLFLARENLPDGVRAHWEGRDGISVITREEWRGQPPRQPGVLLVVGEVTTLGPLVWVSLDRRVREERAADESPRGWASGARFLLLRTEEGWEALSVAEWIT